MHIVAIEGTPTLLAGGQERSQLEVISGFRRRGASVTLAYEQDGELLETYGRLGVRTVRIPTRMLVLKSRTVLRNLLAFAMTIRLICHAARTGKDRVTVLYANQYFDILVAVVCGRLLRVPVICHLRLAAPPYLSRQFRWGLRQCHILVCNSQFTATTYARAGLPIQSIRVVHNAIDTSQYVPAKRMGADALARPNERLILYVGRLAPEKGIETLIEAMALLPSSNSRVRLLVVGNAIGINAPEEYAQRLRRLGYERLGARIEFRSATADVVSLYQSADLTVVPSVWDEPFGRVILESMSCGVPCLASRVGGIPEIMEEKFDSLLFERGSVTQLSLLIGRHLDWRTRNPGLGEACRAHVIERFDSSEMLTKLFRLVRDAESTAVRSP